MIQANGSGTVSRYQRLVSVIVTGALLAAGLLTCGIAAADDSRPTVVVLPPRLVSGAGDQAIAAAELACDRLAQELGKSDWCRVVDRSQLDRILKERKIGPDPSARMISYDAMVRLEVDIVRPAPKVSLCVVDLSDGNMLAQAEFPWTPALPDDVLRDMLKTCQAAVRAAASGAPKALRVRLLDVDNASKSARMEPLAAKLKETFAAAIGKSDGIRLIHHLEAQSAKEESLLLLMGLAQLPGGRQFVPQADVVIELKIQESDGVGKTFDQTRVEVSFRLGKAGQTDAHWVRAGGLVKDYDKVLGQVWGSCAKDLKGTSPRAVGDYLDEMAVRRKQAQAELDAGGGVSEYDRQKARQTLAHVQAAAKLDPAWEEPAYRLVFATANAWRDGVGYDFDAREAGIYEALHYLQRFRADPKRRNTVGNTAFFWAWDRFINLRGFEKVELSGKDRRALDALKEIVDIFLAGPSEDMPGFLFRPMHLVYRGMSLTGVDKASRREWMGRVIRADERSCVPAGGARSEAQIKALAECQFMIRTAAAQITMDEGDNPATRAYIEQIIPLLPEAHIRKDSCGGIYSMVEKLNDPALKAKLDAAFKPILTVGAVAIDWKDFGVWGKPPMKPGIGVKVREIQTEKYARTSCLCAIGGRMYVTVWDSASVTADPNTGNKPVLVGYVEMDDQQRPAGDMKLLTEQPKTRKPMSMQCHAVSKGKLYIGTPDSGLLEYDPDKDRWTVLAVEQGLPGWCVMTLVPLEDGTLFCAGKDGYNTAGGFYCLVSPAKREVKLLRRVDGRDYKDILAPRIFPAWVADKKVTGFLAGSGRDLIDNALAAKSAIRPMQVQPPEGWPQALPCQNSPTSMTIIAGRRYVMARDALREIDDGGKTLRTWWNTGWIPIAAATPAMSGMDVPVPIDLPSLEGAAGYEIISQDDSHIYFVDQRILCFDPASDTWYGPLYTDPWNCGPDTAVPARHGLWLNGRGKISYLDTDDFIAAATKADRVITDKEFRRRREEYIAHLPAMGQAQWALRYHQLQKACDLCQAVLREQPNDPQALHLMGIVCDPSLLNRPDRAMECYGRLAEMAGNPQAVFIGLYQQWRLNAAAKKYAEALQLGKRMEKEFPDYLYRGDLVRQNRWMESQIREKGK